MALRSLLCASLFALGPVSVSAAPQSALMPARVGGDSDWTIVEGDILVPTDPALRSTYGGIAWSGGVVPYQFHVSVDATNQQIALDAMAEWEARADVTFIPQTSESNYIEIRARGTNSSSVGMIGGGQIMRILTWSSFYTVVHEFGHALGLWHEHTRLDRDCYVDILYGNIVDSLEHNFNLRPSGADVALYDFESVMHYPKCAGSICGNCTTVPGCEAIRPLTQYGRYLDVMGQRSYISEGDARGMGARYGFSKPDCNGNHIDDAFELAGNDCNSNSILDACETDCNGNGVPDDCDITLGTSLDLNTNTIPDECEGAVAILRVDPSAIGAGNGATWADAFIDLQAALTLARAASGTVDEVWVKAGTYKPGLLQADTFELVNGVALYGGFAGNENARDERNVALNPTVLDGDLNGDDLGSFLNRTDNSFSVLAAPLGTDSTAVFDGFVVRGGNAPLGGASGAGMTCLGAPTVRDCEFTENSTGGAGRGGGVYVFEADPVFANCRFVRNRAAIGGGVASVRAYPVFINCVFRLNQSTGSYGGGMGSEDGGPWIANGTFYANGCAGFGGGYGHSGSEGGAVLYNTILRGNADGGGFDETAQVDHDAGLLTIEYCCVDGWTGGLGGTGNFDANPFFVDAPGGDMRLQLRSACLDAGDDVKLPPDLADLDDDGDRVEKVPTDHAGDPRVREIRTWDGVASSTVIDVGAYEHQNWARRPTGTQAGGLANDP